MGSVTHHEKKFSDPDWVMPETIYGRDLLRNATDTKERYVVVTMEIPWNMARGNVVNRPEKVIYVENMLLESLYETEKKIPDDIDLVIGIGGGSSHDTAKYVALKRNARLIQFPTIFGGDAVVTSAIGIRRNRKVEYIAHVYTDKIYIDFGLIGEAPKELVRYGACDILSSYTALLDWEYAYKKGLETYDAKIAGYAKNGLLKRLDDNADNIRECNEEGIRTIIELFLEYHKLAHILDSDRPQEGSEHFFAYNAEYVTRRTFVHGRLLALGIMVVGGVLYGFDEYLDDLLRRLGLEYSLGGAGLTAGELEQTLRTLKDFARSGSYYHSIVHDTDMTDGLVRDITKILTD